MITVGFVFKRVDQNQVGLPLLLPEVHEPDLQQIRSGMEGQADNDLPKESDEALVLVADEALNPETSQG